jgi:hypothetical protein
MSDKDIHVGVLVEDLASGILLSSALRSTEIRCSVTVNYGTKVSPAILHRSRNFDVGLVWLDNDGEHITEQAHKIAKVWAMLSGKPIEIEHNEPDPKNLVPPKMVEVIRKWTALDG